VFVHRLAAHDVGSFQHKHTRHEVEQWGQWWWHGQGQKEAETIEPDESCRLDGLKPVVEAEGQREKTTSPVTTVVGHVIHRGSA